MRKFLALALAALSAALPALPSAALSDAPLTRGQLLTGYFSLLFPGDLPAADVPALAFPDVGDDAGLRAALEKAVAFGLLPNSPARVQPGRTATDRDLALLLRAHWGLSWPAAGTALSAQNAGQALSALANLPGVRALRTLSLKAAQPGVLTIDVGGGQGGGDLAKTSNYAVLDGVYRNLRADHYDAAKITDEQLVYGAAKGMAEATGDKWAAFFPPTEAKEFQEMLTGEYEGIGAYVDMEQAGVLTVTSPIIGSPAEKAGLKPADRIVKIGGVDVTDKMDLKAAVALIKGPAGTAVTLTVLRAGQTLTFTVTRAKVTIGFVEDKALSKDAYLIRITTFGIGSAKDFKAALDRMDAAKPSRVVIDLRNDPGGSLEEVSDMLSQLVPKNEPTVFIRYRDTTSSVASSGPAKAYFSGRTVTVLTNGGTASASEIMAGTLKDYYPSSLRTVGEKSYGKGSVQTQVMFDEGSSMKFTIAKWFTGKSHTGIDGTGISPDLPMAAATGTTAGTGAAMAGTGASDPQLQYAQTVKF